jgi:oligoribonuclease
MTDTQKQHDEVIQNNSFAGLMENIRINAESTFFIGIDKETGGLNDADHLDDENIPKGSHGARHYGILQIAVIVYNGLFEQMGKPLDVIIYHSEEYLDKHVGTWSKEQFKDTLMIQCPKAKWTLDQVEAMVVKHINDLGIKEGDNVYMLGNSIRLDFEFMSAQMKAMKKLFKFRLMDVSTLKVLFTTLYGPEIARFEKQANHDALDDILESVGELRFYLDNFIKPVEQVVQEYLDKQK